jgi:hypothetical protein
METTCKQGKLIISDRSVQVVAPFNRVVWNVQRSAIIGVSVKRGALLNTIVFQTAAGQFKAESIAKGKTQEIVEMFS